MKVVNITEAEGVFCDALVTNAFNQIVFCSLWGRNAEIKTLIAQITVGDVSTLTVSDEVFSVSKELTKNITKVSSNHGYGELLHVFMYSPQCIEADANTRYLLCDDNKHPSSTQLFRAIEGITQIPLLFDWESVIVDIAKEKGWISPLETAIGRVSGVAITLPKDEDFGREVSQLLHQNKLQVA